jgi:NAD(P)H-nitrite reductase large subunit
MISLTEPPMAPSTTGESRPHGQALICHCFKVTESEVREAIALHQPREVEQVLELTNAGGGCRACHCRMGRLLDGLPVDCRRFCEILNRCVRQPDTTGETAPSDLVFPLE